MAEQSFLNQLVSVALISRRSNVATDSLASEGMGPSDNAGNFEPVLVSGIQLSVPCRVAQQSARARIITKQSSEDTVVSTLTIFTDYRTDIQDRDRFEVEGVFYDTRTPNDPGLLHHHLEFTARRVS